MCEKCDHQKNIHTEFQKLMPELNAIANKAYDIFNSGPTEVITVESERGMTLEEARKKDEFTILMLQHMLGFMLPFSLPDVNDAPDAVSHYSNAFIQSGIQGFIVATKIASEQEINLMQTVGGIH